MLYLRLFILFISGTIGAFANYDRDSDIQWIFEHAGNAIRNVNDNRIYLESSKIQISNEHIFLLTDSNDMIPIFSLFSSEDGVYVELGDIRNTRIFNWWKCPNPGCRRWNIPEVNICQWCHTPRVQTDE